MKENEKLKNDNERLKKQTENALKEAEAEVLSARKECDAKISQAEHMRSQANDEYNKNKELRQAVEKEIDKSAEHKIAFLKELYERDYCKKMEEDETEHKSKMEKLETEYKNKSVKLKTYLGILALISLVATVLSIIRIPTIYEDFIAFWIGFGHVFIVIVKGIWFVIDWIASLADYIPIKAVAVILHWLIVIASIGTIGLGIFIGVMKLKNFRLKQMNRKYDRGIFGLIVAILVIFVYFGDKISMVISFNLFALWFIISIVLSVIEVFKISQFNVMFD